MCGKLPRSNVWKNLIYGIHEKAFCAITEMEKANGWMMSMNREKNNERNFPVSPEGLSCCPKTNARIARIENPTLFSHQNEMCHLQR